MFSISLVSRIKDAMPSIFVWKFSLLFSCEILLLLKLSRVVYDSSLLRILEKSTFVAQSERLISTYSRAEIEHF